MQSIRVIDSHTGGEPTRIIIEGGPDLGQGDIQSKLERFRNHFDHYRSAVVNEPRGSDVMVGGLYLPADHPDENPGVLFFNNVGFLGMCGHGTIGLMVTLHHLGIVDLGKQTIETPVGPVVATLESRNQVRIENVASYRTIAQVEIEVDGLGPVRGDVAWGGNWFFLVDLPDVSLHQSNVEALTDKAWRIRQAINAQGYPEVDHVELFGPALSEGADSRNFVLCPGKAYDRSPCGTGTSAKLACLAADGKLIEGQPWVQESILGSRFEGRFRWHDNEKGIVIPEICGTAYITADSNLLIDDQDSLRWGIRVE